MKNREIEDVKQLIRKIEAQYDNSRMNDKPSWYDILMLCKYIRMALENIE